MERQRGKLVHDVNAASIPELVASNDIVLLEWIASGCAACNAVDAEVQQAAQSHPDVLFGRVQVDGPERELAAELGIDALPALSIFREQVLLYSRAGALPRRTLEDLVHQTRRLDMGEVHAVLAEAERERMLRS